MPLSQGFPGHSALATFADVRRDLEGSVVRDAAGKMRAGVFPAHFNALVTGRSDMKVAIADFRAVIDRGGAIFMANVGADTSVTLDAAPAANRRIDLIYAIQQSTTLGDAASLPIFGFVKGTASATPVAPSLPANLSTALPLATVEIPAGATTTLSAGVVITQVFPYTAMAGGTVAVRRSVELTAWAPADGAKAVHLADSREYLRRGAGWVGVSTVANLVSAEVASNSWSVFASAGSWAIAESMQASPWNSGIVIPVAGLYEITGSIFLAATIQLIFAAKLNNTGASSTGIVASGQTTGFSGETRISFARTMTLQAGDVITPAAFTTGTTGPYGVTPGGTHIAVTRIG